MSGCLRLRDSLIWKRAMETDAVILSKDEDFATRRSMTSQGPCVIWIRLRNSRRSEVLLWFEKALPRVSEALARGEVLVELV